ncbi:D-alanyl-D-alanine-carboxypeptidase/endopeptidaseAmpH precursor [Legionella massiliensis]|uniref:D-alanyl-D-alanine-carboxypeptidase/endopeptidase AmpH n=1 Tax=Legionella massiliensis TaxID=1034943 RepID=A0A078KW29_9GAMM|nr:serine hydrolase [Legionella massiliensis]CDZ77201.1 D-alanyl-D-alanine-carboxypeptidase/endopeptidaseAmpH precursor [Legionella massiliensis]CEE12939.1 D-alanyl-D-alanine-carboxypeptidase/endopeptidaseAmpH precursor [Legionella massiliensis]
MFLRIIAASLTITMSFVVEAASPVCQYIEKANIKTLPLESIADYVQHFVFEQSGVPALMIGISSDDERAVLSCGETKLNNGQRPALSTVWPVGSVSKVFTTDMLAKMVNRGDVKLNTSVNELLGLSTEAEHPITLLDLATHSSGFPRGLPTIPASDDYQINQPYEMKEFLSWYPSFQRKPGTHYQYSNLGYGLLGQLLAKKMAKDYNGLLQELISEPLQLKDTTTSLNKEQAAREVSSYWMNGDLIRKDWEFKFEQPSGGIYSTMQDLMIFAQYQLGNKPKEQENARIAHASYIYQNQFDNPLDFSKDAMALGWSVDFPAQALPLRLTKNGWVDGVNTHIVLSPTKDIALVSFTNKPYLNIETDLHRIIGMILNTRKN